MIVGIRGPGGKYGLYVLPTCGIPVRYGFAACREILSYSYNQLIQNKNPLDFPRDLKTRLQGLQ